MEKKESKQKKKCFGIARKLTMLWIIRVIMAPIVVDSDGILIKGFKKWQEKWKYEKKTEIFKP